MLEIKSPCFIDENRLREAGRVEELFEEEGPLSLEIGCGIGDFIIQKALREPGTNFLAVDIYNKGCLKTCKKVDARGLPNVRVLRMEARYLLDSYVAPESLMAVYINCPDPWPKKRHRPRRLVNRTFLQALLYYLRPEGSLYFSTDFRDYAEEVAASLLTLPGYENCQTDAFSNHLPGYPLSKYMRRFLEEGAPLHFIHYQKKKNFSIEADQLPPLSSGFRLPWAKVENE